MTSVVKTECIEPNDFESQTLKVKNNVFFEAKKVSKRLMVIFQVIYSYVVTVFVTRMRVVCSTRWQADPSVSVDLASLCTRARATQIVDPASVGSGTATDVNPSVSLC